MSKISIGNVNQIIKNNKADNVVVSVKGKDKDYSIEFKPYLFLDDESKFIQRVVDFSFDVNTKDYLSEYSQLGKEIAILQYFTNVQIPTLDDKSTIDINKCKDLVNAINLRHVIDGWKKSSDDTNECKLHDYITDLCILVDKKIDYLKNKSKADVLFETVTKQVNNFGDKFRDVDMKQFANDLHKISGMMGKFDDKEVIDEIIKVSQKLNKSKDNITKISEVKDK